MQEQDGQVAADFFKEDKFISLLTPTLKEKVELKDLDTYATVMQIAKEKYRKMHMVHQS